MLKVINLFAGPGCGKSTLAAGVFHRMKVEGRSVEYVDEYAKQMTWEDRQKEMSNQIYIFAKQYKKLQRLVGKVEWAVTDCPLVMNLAYCSRTYFANYAPLVMEVAGGFDNRNFLLERNVPFESSGRNQDLAQAIQKDKEIEAILLSYTSTMNFTRISSSGAKGVSQIIQSIGL
jgi:ABC-type glutathione transport system ATPase component